VSELDDPETKRRKTIIAKSTEQEFIIIIRRTKKGKHHQHKGDANGEKRNGKNITRTHTARTRN